MITLKEKIHIQVRLWRDYALTLNINSVDASYDTRRLIKERVEAITICAEELEKLVNEE